MADNDTGLGQGGAGFSSLPYAPFTYTHATNDPPAGFDPVFATSASAISELVYMSGTLVCSAAAANRQVNLSIALPDPPYTGNPKIHFQASNVTLTANGTITYTVVLAPVNPYGLAGRQYWGIPQGILLPPSTIVSFQTDNLQAGDNWGATTVVFREFSGQQLLLYTAR